MNRLVNMLGLAEQMIQGQADIDIVFKTRDKEGDGYAFAFIDEEGNFDVSLLQDRIPAGIMNTDNGRQNVSQMFQEGKQYWLKEKTLLDVVNSVFNFWCVPDSLRDIYSIEVDEDHSVRLFLVEKSKREG